MLLASDGNFYGTTRAGGISHCSVVGCGAIFKMTPAGQVSVVYQFGSIINDLYRPTGKLIQGKDGLLYGVTTNGGLYGGGGIFKLTAGGAYTLLHSFAATPNDANVPIGLIQASDGNFYGTTATGGTNRCVQIPQGDGNCGTIFKMSPAGVVTVIHSFGNSVSDGVQPAGPLVEASDGNFYGVTQNGGANACSSSSATNNCGTAFRMTPAGVVTILHSFGASSSDGIAPGGALIQGSDGALYGTSASGGRGQCGNLFGCGVVYRMTLSGAVTTVYEFAAVSIPGVSPAADGSGPSNLVQGSDGNLYGTTTLGGSFWNGGVSTGTLFRLTPAGVKTVLYSFGPDPTVPAGPLGFVIGPNGAFYGITTYSGNFGATGPTIGSGTIYRLTLQ